MGKLILIIVLGSVIATMVLQQSELDSSAEQTETASIYENKVISRNIAYSGVKLVESQLRSEPDGYRPSGVVLHTNEGELIITATGPADGPVEVTIRGTSNGAETVVVTQYDIVTSGEEPPSFMAGGIIAGNTLEFEKPSSVDGNGGTNANVHADNDLKIKDELHVSGFGSAGNNIQNDSGMSLEDIFEPNSNPDALPVASEDVSNLNPPDPSSSEAKENADHISSGSASWKGVINLGGSANDPEVWFWGKDAKTTGKVTINGHAVVFIGNTLEINHDFRVNGQVSFYVINDIKLKNADVEITGILYSGNSITIEDSAELKLTGSMTATNDIKAKGPVEVKYRPAALPYFEAVGFEAQGADSGNATITRTRFHIVSE